MPFYGLVTKQVTQPFARFGFSGIKMNHLYTKFQICISQFTGTYIKNRSILREIFLGA